MSEIKYKRVLLKLSGEMLGGQEKRGIDISVLDEISNQIKRMLEAKAEMAIVIGAGNFWRGKKEDEIERTPSIVFPTNIASAFISAALKAAAVSVVK